MDIKKLEQFLKERGEEGFRLRQIKKAVFQDAVGSFDEITSLPKELREKLAENFETLPFLAEAVLGSKDKKSFKALLKLKDGKCIETVLMNPVRSNSDKRISNGANPVGDVWSVCVSTQVGCAMMCVFCATGKLGFQRNLTSEEIWGQVLFWKQWMKRERDYFVASLRFVPCNDKMEARISNVVYMGMGEPFNNLENVFESIKVLTDKEMFGIGQRGISVSTSGILPGIEKFGEQFPQVNLAISLHGANDKLRSELMPVNKTYNLKKLAESLKKYFAKSKRQVFVEYILLNGKNDSLAHAGELADYLKIIGHRHLLHVNLIIFNPIGNVKNLGSRLRGNDNEKGGNGKIENGNSNIFYPSSKERARKFKDFLIKSGISATIRKSMGQDIRGACGQLAGNQRILYNIKKAVDNK